MDGNELDGARIVVEASHGGRDRDRRGPGSDECFSCGGRGHWYVAWLLSSYLNTHTHQSFPPISSFFLFFQFAGPATVHQAGIYSFVFFMCRVLSVKR